MVLFKWLLPAGADGDASRDLVRFTDFAVQFRYDTDPDPMGLDRAHRLRWAEQLVEHVASLTGS